MLFTRFELNTSAWRNVLKLVLLLGGTALISRYAGAVWAWVWIFGTLALGISVHVWWTRSHGIDVFMPNLVIVITRCAAGASTSDAAPNSSFSLWKLEHDRLERLWALLIYYVIFCSTIPCAP